MSRHELNLVRVGTVCAVGPIMPGHLSVMWTRWESASYDAGQYWDRWKAFAISGRGVSHHRQEART